MFTALGKGVSKHPKIFVLLWAILVAVGALAGMWGFGTGNIFQRLSSTESMVPGSESDEVIARMDAEESGMSITTVVAGVSETDLGPALADFKQVVTAIPHVDTVADPVTVDAEFTKALDEQVAAAADQALADNADQIDAAIAGALAQAEPELSQLPVPEMRAAAEQDIRDQARAVAEEEIRTAALEAAQDEAAKAVNPAEEFRSDNGFVVLVTLEPGEFDESHDAVVAAADNLAAAAADAGGQAYTGSMKLYEGLIMDQIAVDLVRGEGIGLPVALFLLVIVFGGLIAAGLPLTGAIVSIGIGIGVLWLLTFNRPVDNFVLNVISIIGLALSIDYGLLIVSRYREEIARGLARRGKSATDLPDDVHALVTEAVSETVATAGRTVAFSALTIIFSIAGLLVMEAPMLRVIAIGGIVVTAFAVATAITLVPALIELLGVKLVRPSVLTKVPGMRALVKRVGDAASDEGAFSKLARWVHRRPWPVLIITAGLLLAAAWPIQGLAMRSNFIEYVPASDAKTGYELMQADYPAFRTPSALVIAETNDPAELVSEIETLDGVDRVTTESTGSGDSLVSVYVTADDPVGQEVTDTVLAIRDIDTEYETFVGGSAAIQHDFNASLERGAPAALGIILAAVFALLFLLTASVIAPLKAIIINTLSLLAGLGLTYLVFQHGLFGLPQGGLETFVVAIALTFGFGLAMDYEVFLVARIKEFWDAGYDNDTAVEKGLQRSGRIITSAAAIIIAVFVGFVFGDLKPIKQIGVALAIIVTVDATIVRMLLVPSLMTLLGKWNWWAPTWAHRIYERFRPARSTDSTLSVSKQ